jgi:hypothetical protein
MLPSPTAMDALGPGLTRKYVDMTFFRVESVASVQLQQYLYMEYIYRSETRYVTYNVLDNLKFISMITVFDLNTNNKTQLSK